MAAVLKAISHAKPASTRKLDSLFHLHLKLTYLKKKFHEVLTYSY